MSTLDQISQSIQNIAKSTADITAQKGGTLSAGFQKAFPGVTSGGSTSAPATSVSSPTQTYQAPPPQRTQTQTTQQSTAPAVTPSTQQPNATGTPYAGTSVVDYLSSVQQPSDMNSRIQLANQFGIKGYTGTADQNTQLLNTLKANNNPAQGPQSATNQYQRFQDGHQAATNAGATAPTDTQGAVNMFSKYLSPETQGNPMSVFVAQDPYLNSMSKAFQQYMSQQNQRTSLVDTYKSMLKDSGIQQMDTDLINMKNVIDGTEDDIRTEVTKAGGFATDSQVIALGNARNKQLIKNYNTLLETRDSKQKYLDTMMNLTEQDRAAADKSFDTMMNFDTQMSNAYQKMQTNAVSTLDNVAKTVGWDGILDATKGDTQLQAQIERTYGLPAGDLAIAAQRAKEARIQAQTGNALDIQMKQEQIKTSQAQRANIYSEIADRNNKSGAQPGTPINPQTGKALKDLTDAKAKELRTAVGVVEDANTLKDLLNKGFSPAMFYAPFNTDAATYRAAYNRIFHTYASQISTQLLRSQAGIDSVERILPSAFNTKEGNISNLNSLINVGTQMGNLIDPTTGYRRNIGATEGLNNQSKTMTQSDGSVWQQNSNGSYTRIK